MTKPESQPEHADWTRTQCAQHYMTDERCGSWCEPARLAFLQAAAALDDYWRRQAVSTEYQRRYGQRHVEFASTVGSRVRSVA